MIVEDVKALSRGFEALTETCPEERLASKTDDLWIDGSFNSPLGFPTTRSKPLDLHVVILNTLDLVDHHEVIFLGGVSHLSLLDHLVTVFFLDVVCPLRFCLGLVRLQLSWEVGFLG